jgi:hypothetical protein
MGDSAVPAQHGPPPQPVTLINTGFNQTLLPGGYLATQQLVAPPRQTQPMMQDTTTVPWVFGGMGRDFGCIGGESGESLAGAAPAKNSRGWRAHD